MRVEIVVLAIYFIGMIGMGLFWNRRAKVPEDYAGGGSMGPLVTATLQTTAMSGFMFMGGRQAYLYGLFRCCFLRRRRRCRQRVDQYIGAGKKEVERCPQLLDSISPIEYLEKAVRITAVKESSPVLSPSFGLDAMCAGQF